MNKTSALEKLLMSAINAIAVIFISIPFLILVESVFYKKIIVISVFFLFNLFFLVFNKNRCLGMILRKANYCKKHSTKENLVYITLYTLSFSTLFFWIMFPFDLFLINMLLIQLPFIYKTGTTFQGFMSGKLTTIK